MTWSGVLLSVEKNVTPAAAEFGLTFCSLALGQGHLRRTQPLASQCGHIFVSPAHAWVGLDECKRPLRKDTVSLNNSVKIKEQIALGTPPASIACLCLPDAVFQQLLKPLQKAVFRRMGEEGPLHDLPPLTLLNALASLNGTGSSPFASENNNNVYEISHVQKNSHGHFAYSNYYCVTSSVIQ